MKWWRSAGASLLLRRSPLARFLVSLRDSVRCYQTIEAVPREFTGHRLAAKERKLGRIPAVVLDPNETNGPSSCKQLVTTDTKQIQNILKNSPYFCSTIFNLQVRAGPGSGVVLQSGKVLPVKVHKNGETREILNLVMAWVEKGVEMKVVVPLVFKGMDACPGLKKGGYLRKRRSALKYLCPTEHIPQKIEVDLSNLDIDDQILMQDVKVHPSLKLLSKDDTVPICKILATKPAERQVEEISRGDEATRKADATTP